MNNQAKNDSTETTTPDGERFGAAPCSVATPPEASRDINDGWLVLDHRTGRSVTFVMNPAGQLWCVGDFALANHMAEQISRFRGKWEDSPSNGCFIYVGEWDGENYKFRKTPVADGSHAA